MSLIDVNSINSPVPTYGAAGAPFNNVANVVPNNRYGFHPLWADLDNTDADGDTKRVVIYLPSSVNFKPTTVILSDPDNTTLEVSCDYPGNIANPPEDEAPPQPVWAGIDSPTALNIIASTITAVRITNTGTGLISARIA